jgi:hypothetical protein
MLESGIVPVDLARLGGRHDIGEHGWGHNLSWFPIRSDRTVGPCTLGVKRTKSLLLCGQLSLVRVGRRVNSSGRRRSTQGFRSWRRRRCLSASRYLQCHVTYNGPMQSRIDGSGIPAVG